MTRLRTAAGALALALAATGCGVQSTGVLDGGEPASGLTNDLRIYFVRGSGLQGVTRPDVPITRPEGVIKLLMAEPTAAEQERGLANLVELGSYRTSTSGSGDRITLHAPGGYFNGERDRLPNGQLVCSLARAQSFLHRDDPGGAIRPDDVRVSLDDGTRTYGPYQCSQFLTG